MATENQYKEFMKRIAANDKEVTVDDFLVYWGRSGSDMDKAVNLYDLYKEFMKRIAPNDEEVTFDDFLNFLGDAGDDMDEAVKLYVWDKKSEASLKKLVPPKPAVPSPVKSGDKFMEVPVIQVQGKKDVDRKFFKEVINAAFKETPSDKDFDVYMDLGNQDVKEAVRLYTQDKFNQTMLKKFVSRLYGENLSDYDADMYMQLGHDDVDKAMDKYEEEQQKKSAGPTGNLDSLYRLTQVIPVDNMNMLQMGQLFMNLDIPLPVASKLGFELAQAKSIDPEFEYKEPVFESVQVPKLGKNMCPFCRDELDSDHPLSGHILDLDSDGTEKKSVCIKEKMKVFTRLGMYLDLKPGKDYLNDVERKVLQQSIDALCKAYSIDEVDAEGWIKDLEEDIAKHYLDKLPLWTELGIRQDIWNFLQSRVNNYGRISTSPLPGGFNNALLALLPK